MEDYEELEDDFEYENDEDALRALEKEADVRNNDDEENMDIVDKLMKRGEQQLISEAQDLALKLKNG